MHVYRIFAGLLSLKVLSPFVKDIPPILRQISTNILSNIRQRNIRK